jgi:hypothetical protein
MGEPSDEDREKAMTIEEERRVLVGYAKRHGMQVRKQPGSTRWRVYRDGSPAAWGTYVEVLWYLRGYSEGHDRAAANAVIRTTELAV